MDPLKTAFIANLPENLPVDKQDAVFTAFKPLGLAKWVPAEPGTGFAQLGSAAQMKAALEVLPAAGLSITVSLDTKTWVLRAAAKASVQNVTRMSATYLANKIRTILAKAQAVRAGDKPGAHVAPHIQPDGTLDSQDPRLLAEIRRFREHSLAEYNKINTIGAEATVPPPKRQRVSAHQSRGTDQIEPHSQSQSALTSVALVETGDPRNLELKKPELEKEKTLSGEVRVSRSEMQQPELGNVELEKPGLEQPGHGTHESGQPEPDHPDLEQPGLKQRHAEPEPGSKTTESDHPEQPANDMLSQLPAIVEEFFGEPDADVVQTVEAHIREQRSTAALAAEFKYVLEDDFPRFETAVARLMSFTTT